MTATTPSREAARAALDWLVASGADVLVADRPRAWLEPDAPASAQRSTPRISAAPARASRAAQPLDPGQNSSPLAEAATNARSPEELLAIARTHAGPHALLFDGAIGETPLFVIGAPAPGDLREGRLLSGPAGTLFDRMLRSIGLARERAWIAAAALRSAGEAQETELVRRLIALTRPRAVAALGNFATVRLTGDTRGLNRIHGKWIEAVSSGYTTKIMPMLDPDHLLNHPHHKAIAWADLLLFKREL